MTAIPPVQSEKTLKFIEKASVEHNCFYGYCRVEYVAGRDKVTIICSIHGEFRGQ